MIKMTSKTARFLRVIQINPGITAAEIHRRIGGDYAHGHHKFSYATIARARRNGLIERTAPAEGLRGVGLRTTARAQDLSIADGQDD